MSSFDQGYSCVECEHSYDDRDGNTDKRMCNKCLNMLYGEQISFCYDYEEVNSAHELLKEAKMKCKRCGGNEDRIYGFCSIYCKNMSYGEDDAKLLETVRKNIIDHWHIADQFCSHSRLAEIVVMRVSELRDYENQQLVFDCSEFEKDVTDE